jgi:tRNA A-37 threonylcarbamoyl transferase component Bud32
LHLTSRADLRFPASWPGFAPKSVQFGAQGVDRRPWPDARPRRGPASALETAGERRRAPGADQSAEARDEFRHTADPMRRSGAAEWLLASQYFEPLTPEAVDLVAARMSPRRFAAGDALIRQGDTGSEVFFVVDGSLDVRLRRRDGEQPLASVGPGAVLGEIALVTGAPRAADVVATTDGAAYVLAASDFDAAAREVPELFQVMTSIVAQRLGRAALDGLGDKVIEGFRVVRPIGRGASAVVYEAERLEDGARVALKMMSHSFARDAAAVARFERESELLAGVSHPGVAPCRGRFRAYGTVFLVMDLVEGASLHQVIRSGGAIAPAELAPAFRSIAAALAHVHRSGVVHCDLKPANVLVASDGTPRLTDFGIAERVCAEAATTDRVVAGSPAYMAPESFAGEAPSSATDLYALGCVLFEMARGRPLFDQPDLGAVWRAKRGFDAEARAGELDPLDPDLARAFRALLSADPRARKMDESMCVWGGRLARGRVARAVERRAAAASETPSPTTWI